jgi:hypothetical protein
MPARRKTIAGVLKGFHYDQPFIGFNTQFRTTPVGGGKPQVHSMNYGGSCREELVWDAREFLQGKTVSWKTNRGTWQRTASLVRRVDIEHTSLKQPGVTYLWVANDPDEYDYHQSICRRACCIGRFPALMDAVAGPVAVLLNDDRYLGDWWTTSPAETSLKNKNELRWYGTDNFFLRHPVLTSLMMGMFRQGVLLFEQGFDEALLKAVDRKEVEDCLSNADPALAKRILTKLRPWIEVPQQNLAPNFSFPKSYWHRLDQTHRAVYNHGYEALFGGDIQKSWNLGQGEAAGRYEIPNGPIAYWGTTGKVTPAGELLAKLGK